MEIAVAEPAPQHPFRTGKLKNLVLCLDGTWNSDDGQEITNIVRIRDLVDPKFHEKDKDEVVTQRVYYDTGVGTGLRWADKFVGGVSGAGLEQNVRQAYRFLSQFYSPGIEIYIFGFSRGAFTARSVAGYIGAAGLLMPEFCTHQNEEKAWSLYRTPPGDRYPSEICELRRLTFPDVRIKCLGVFDTVGARGIPTELLKLRNRRRYGFHDVTLGANVDHALHALAIDELRGPFGASVWQYPNHKNNISVEQVWFPGVHANIGGGYPDSAMSDIALEWMLSRTEAKGLGLKLVDDWRLGFSLPNPLGTVYESRSVLYTASRIWPQVRVINQTVPKIKTRHRLSRLAPHAVPLGESLHWSALNRWTTSVSKPDAVQRYAPENMIAAIDALFEPLSPKRLSIIGTEGRPLDWYRDATDRAEFSALLPPAYQAKMTGALAIWNSAGVDMSSFLDTSRPHVSPVAVRSQTMI
jgi:uncharacterized protein (DUF2235 family)